MPCTYVQASSCVLSSSPSLSAGLKSTQNFITWQHAFATSLSSCILHSRLHMACHIVLSWSPCYIADVSPVHPVDILLAVKVGLLACHFAMPVRLISVSVHALRGIVSALHRFSSIRWPCIGVPVSDYYGHATMLMLYPLCCDCYEFDYVSYCHALDVDLRLSSAGMSS